MQPIKSNPTKRSEPCRMFKQAGTGAVLFALTLFPAVDSIAQTGRTQAPQFSTHAPIIPGISHTYQPQHSHNPYQPPSAEQIKQQQQLQHHHSGHNRAKHNEIKNERQGVSDYSNPPASNNFYQVPPQIRRQQELDEIFKDVNGYGREMSEEEYRASSFFQNDFQHYREAAGQIKEMLEGKRKQSLKEAYYLAESAYGNLPLTYGEYNSIIRENAGFIRQWLLENGYLLQDSEALHLGIHKFLSDTLYTGKNTDNISLSGKVHYPYRYDYIDAQATGDRRNYFVTKTLATGTGQCHTLPAAYLLLAEALGVPAALAYNPRHSFIRYKNNQGVTLNYETTIDRFLPDQFYLETLPKMAKAQKNRLYINGLSKRQIIATVLLDLAVNFVREHRLADRKFIEECLKAAALHFDEKEYVNSSYAYLKKRLLADTFNRKVKERKLQTVEEIEKHPDIIEDYNRFRDYIITIEQLGVQDFPEEEYIRMMSYHDEKGRLQNLENSNAKKKKSLFFNY